MRKPTCETCRFYFGRLCLRYPSPVQKEPLYWCGEHSPANQDQPQPEPEPVADPVDGVNRQSVDQAPEADALQRLFAEVVAIMSNHPLRGTEAILTAAPNSRRDRALAHLRTGIAAMTKAVPDDEVIRILDEESAFTDATSARDALDTIRAHGLQITRIPGCMK